MKKILLFLISFLMACCLQGQTITDSAALRTAVNTDIVSNATGGITATKLNRILNGMVTVIGKHAYKGLAVDLPIDYRPGALKDTIGFPTASGSQDGYLTSIKYGQFDAKWGPSGNAVSSGSFLGTTNTEPVIFKVNSIEKARVSTTGFSTSGDAIINGVSIGRGISGTTDNTLLGFEALLNNTSNHQVAIGYQVMKASTGGYENVAIGYLAGTLLGSAFENVMIGPYAMYNTSGAAARNVAIGKTSLRLVTGNDNVAIGRHSGLNITSGSNNIMIGSGADALVATANDQINIGGALWARNKKFTIGTSTDAADSANRLAVYGTVKITDTLKTPNIGYKSLDTLNLKLKVVDASGNEFKTNWPVFEGTIKGRNIIWQTINATDADFTAAVGRAYVLPDNTSDRLITFPSPQDADIMRFQVTASSNHWDLSVSVTLPDNATTVSRLDTFVGKWVTIYYDGANLIWKILEQ